MTGLCGWFGDRRDEHAGATLGAMLSAGPTQPAQPVQQTSTRAGLAVFGGVARPQLVEVDGMLLALAGHARWCESNQRLADPATIARALRARGKDALKDLQGDFALAAWDEQRERGLLAIDRIGAHQIVYGRSGSTLVFASNLDMLRGHPGIRSSLSSQGIFDYLYFHVSPGPKTVFDGLMRLPVGHCLEFGEGAPAEPTPYWTANYEEDTSRSTPALEREFLDLLLASVKEAADGAPSGAFLSGGTDSSTVSGMLSRAGNGPAQTFSIGFDAEGYDEMAYARIAAKHYGCAHHEYYVTPKDVVDAVPKIAAWYDQPFGNASAIPAYYCARLAQQHGITRLLAGDGGDELFGGNERYGKQHLLGLYQRVPAALRRGLIEPLLLALPAEGGLAPLRKLRSYVEQARPPMPLRYQSYNLLSYLGHASVFTPDFLASIDAAHPLALLVDAHTPYAKTNLINQMLAIDMRFVLADGDLPKVTQMCALAGVDVTFPLLDDRLLAFAEHLPAPLKLRGTQLRWFFKHALRDFLPPAVITKQKHGFGLPVGTWLIDYKPLLDLACASIDGLRSRGIVQPRFIDELLDKRLREHATYFGNMVWVLMMLGLWLESRNL